MSIMQNLIDGDTDIQAFSLFLNADADAEIPRRLNLPVNSLSHYEQYLEALKSVYTQTTGTVTVDGIAVKPVTVAVRDAIDAAILGNYKTQLEQQIASVAGGRKSYKTYAEMVAKKAEITANSIVDITNDTAENNGAYNYDGTTFTKSAYDPLTQSKTYTDTAKQSAISTAATDATAKANTAKSEAISASATDATNKANTAKSEAIDTASNIFKANSGSEIYAKKDFTVAGGFTSAGGDATNPNWFATPKIAVKKGDTVDVTTYVTSNYPYLVIYNTSGTRLKYLATADAAALRTYPQYIVEQDGFVASEYSPAAPDGVELIINKTAKRFLELVDLQENPVIKNKADEFENRYFIDFEQGGGNYGQTESDNVAQARTTDIYKFKVGTVINLKTMNTSGNNYQIGFGAGSQADIDAGKSPFNTFLAQTDSQITVAEDKPYYRFYIRDQLDATNTLNIAQALSRISIFVEEPVLRDTAIDVGSPSTVTTGYLPPITTPSPFRTPSLAVGGVISFIDDDGRDAVFTGLHPFMKSQNVPYGEAIVPERLNTPTYMTTAQLLQLAKEPQHVEILDHTFNHVNITGATKEAVEADLIKSKRFFAANGIVVDSLVYPFGGDDEPKRAIISKYYQSAYDYGGQARVETFDTISNRTIKRTTWEGKVETVAYHKAKIDEAAASDGWLVICLHIEGATYWYENSFADLTEIIAYARTKGLKFVLPRDGFQIFGNIAENDNGFRIQANGKIVGAT